MGLDRDEGEGEGRPGLYPLADAAFAKVPVQDDAQTGWEQSVDPACDASPDPATAQLRKRRPLARVPQ